MAIKKIQIKPPDGDYADVLHPETDSTQVLMDEQGTTLGTAMGLKADSSALDAHLADIANYNFGNRPYNSKANLTLYVDQVNGNDNFGGLTAGTAFKTFEKVMSKIPINITHNLYIRIIGNYIGNLNIRNINLLDGVISVRGDTMNKDNHTITGNITIENVFRNNLSYGNEALVLHLTVLSASYYAIGVFNSSITIGECKCVASTGIVGGIGCYDSSVNIFSSNFEGSKHGIRGRLNSKIISDRNSGNVTEYGLYASHNSEIAKTGSQPTGTIANEKEEIGGVIR